MRLTDPTSTPHSTKAGASVAFRLIDVVCPDFDQVVNQLGPELRVTGHVAFVSDRGSEEGCFAIVDVSGIHTPLIVPMSRVTPLSNSEGGATDTPWPLPDPVHSVTTESANAGRGICDEGGIDLEVDQPADGEAAG